MHNGWFELLYFLAGVALVVGGIKLFQKETSKDGGFWRKVVGTILFAFGIGTVYGVLSRIFGGVGFLDVHDLVKAVWDNMLVPLWDALRRV